MFRTKLMWWYLHSQQCYRCRPIGAGRCFVMGWELGKGGGGHMAAMARCLPYEVQKLHNFIRITNSYTGKNTTQSQIMRSAGID